MSWARSVIPSIHVYVANYWITQIYLDSHMLFVWQDIMSWPSSFSCINMIPHFVWRFPGFGLRAIYPPWKRGDIGLSLTVCPSVRPSVYPSVRPSVPFDVGYFVQASLVWRSWARAFKFYTRINQGLKSCLVMVLSRSIENCRFWSTLKIVDFKLFFIC